VEARFGAALSACLVANRTPQPSLRASICNIHPLPLSHTHTHPAYLTPGPKLEGDRLDLKPGAALDYTKHQPPSLPAMATQGAGHLDPTRMGEWVSLFGCPGGKFLDASLGDIMLTVTVMGVVHEGIAPL